MKRLILTGLAVSGLWSAQGQLFSPESVNGAMVGAMIGGLAGGDCCHCYSGNSAAIGAGAGFLAGALVGEVRRQSYRAPEPSYYYPMVVYAQPGYGYVYGPAALPAPAQPALAVQPAAPAPGRSYQIPDAPRVPDAPTF